MITALALTFSALPSDAKDVVVRNGLTTEPLEIFQECAVCPEMVVLPQESFTMGAPLEQSAYMYLLWNKEKPGVPNGLRHEGPEHEVMIDIKIAMGRNEITRAEWLACVVERGCSHLPDPRTNRFPRGHYVMDDPRHPVFDVSYLDMLEYVAWLNRKVGAEVYRLPTEAEWEFAARAGTNTKFAQGDTLTTDQANIGLFRREGERAYADPNNRKTAVTVDELDAANQWGLRHMAGNLLERTMSCWRERHLGLATSSAYLAKAKEVENCKRVSKGGAYRASREYARPANRGKALESNRSKRAGFRILREM